MTELQGKVIEAARRKIENKSWFQGVCLDELKNLNDVMIEEIGFDNAVEIVVSDTMAWDAW